ncbi:MAG: hypothetical protein AABN34_02965 [Acidobacteriota bacterium]
MSTREQIVREIDTLSQAELEHVARYVAFVRYQSLINAIPAVDENQLATLYAEFAAEDRQFAEQGMSDYAVALAKEDSE